MVRLDEQARRLHGREVAEGPRPLGAVGVAVAQRGGVAVVAIGDVGLDRAQHLLEGRDAHRVRHPPQTVRGVAVVGVVERGGRAHRLRQRLREAPLGIGQHREDRAEVGAGGLQDLPPIFLRRRPRVLVGQDDPLLRVHRPEAGQEAEAAQGATLGGERLLEHVEGGRVVGAEEAVGPPLREGGSRLGVTRVPGRAVQDHPHDVPGIAGVELVLQGGRDHVVGGGEDTGELRLGDAVEEASEGLDLSHGAGS